MPSVPTHLLLRPSVPNLTSFHGGSCSHRLKRLEKGDRRGFKKFEVVLSDLGAKAFLLLTFFEMDISSPRGKSVLRNVDSLQGLQPSVNQEQIRTSLLEDYSVSGLVSAVGESLNISVGEDSTDVKDVGRESTDIKDVGRESTDVKDVGKESRIDVKDVGRGSIDVKHVGKESIDVKHVGEVEHASDGYNTIGVEKRNTHEDPNAQQGKVARKCLNKCAIFPNPTGVLSPNASASIVKEEPKEALCGDEHHHQACLCSVSLPAPSKLLSALKGSREKEGLSPGKLSVTWAPDVYDPPATSMSHTVTGKKQQKSKNKKNGKKDGKKGQKSSSSRGKDKKQYRKSGASERCHRSLDPRETLVDPNNGFGELVVGSPDQHSYCGSSFLKNSLTNVHYPVAEAL
ncbi:hypothetical protein ACFX15_009246 [Malus domestica]|uniref:Uncharacterized protein n=1 Tax=Malus domestica TaxID=3750 RepID=A0A498IEK4_MALDO|nr:hypothetical protein DVH24_004478 [Malus domestica]